MGMANRLAQDGWTNESQFVQFARLIAWRLMQIVKHIVLGRARLRVLSAAFLNIFFASFVHHLTDRASNGDPLPIERCSSTRCPSAVEVLLDRPIQWRHSSFLRSHISRIFIIAHAFFDFVCELKERESIQRFVIIIHLQPFETIQHNQIKKRVLNVCA